MLELEHRSRRHVESVETLRNEDYNLFWKCYYVNSLYFQVFLLYATRIDLIKKHCSKRPSLIAGLFASYFVLKNSLNFSRKYDFIRNHCIQFQAET